jgi:hypothetical protein
MRLLNLAAITACVLLPDTAHAVLAGYTPFQELLDKADVIVIGTVRGGSSTGGKVAAWMSVDDVIRGDPNMSSLELRWSMTEDLLTGATDVLQRERGMWFLVRDTNHTWRPLPIATAVTVGDAYYRMPPAETGKNSYSETDTESSKILAAIAAAVEYYDGGDGFADRLLYSLSNSNGADVRRMYERLAKAGSPNIRVIGLAGLLQRGDANAMVQTELEYKQFQEQFGQVALVRGLTDFRSTDPVAAVALGRLATTTTDRYQGTAAAYSLCQIHTAATMGYIVKLLDDDDKDVRAYAVAGMSLFAAGLPMVKSDGEISPMVQAWLWPRLDKREFENDAVVHHFHMGPFRDHQEEQESIAFWRKWWQPGRLQQAAGPPH